MASGSLNYWRNYFRAANSDIFDIIDHAIMVAASDCPKEFKLRRDRIAERLFSCRLTRCSGCDKVELAVPGDGEDEDDEDNDDGGCKIDEGGASKESKVNSCTRDDDDPDHEHDQQGEIHNNDVTNMNMNMNHHQLSNYSYGLAEALTDEIEEESQIVEEVLRIKDLFHNSEHESDTVLYESLRKLQLMALNVETLKATEIGKAVNGLRKQGSKQIRHLARTLIGGWKDMVDEWVNATAAIAGTEATSDSVNPSFDDEEGLPSPPLDEGAFFATTTSMELSQFFDGMDDDGNPRNSGGEFNKNRENGRRPSLEKQNIVKQKQQSPNEANVLPKECKNDKVKKQEVAKPSKPSNTESGPGRPPKVSMDQKVNNAAKIQQRTENIAIQRRKLTGQQDKFGRSDEERLEATKRKLQERYQQAENAKRQRTIQVMELHDLPKQGLGHRNSYVKPGNHNRHRAFGRR